MTEPYVSAEAVQPRLSESPRQDPARILIILVGSLLGIFFLYQVGGGALTYLLIGDWSVRPENVVMFRTITLVSQLLFILGPTLLIARFSGIAMRIIFPMRIPSLIEIGLTFLGLIALQRVLETLMYLQSLIPVPELVDTLLGPIKEMVKSMMLTLVGSDSPLEFVAVMLVVAIVPAIVEESFFRGLIQSLFDRLTSPVWGVFGSGIIFGLFHLNPFDAIGLIGLGMFMAYTRYRSASIVIPVFLHFVNNSLAVIAVTAGMDNEELLIESMGQSPGIGLVLGQGALFAALLYVVLRVYDRLTEHLHSSQELTHEM